MMLLAFYFQFESLSFFSYLKSWSKEEGVFCIYFIFFASEVRAAPHMDNLVSIYKSMEIASGFNIFVTQNPPPSTKLSGDAKKKKKTEKKSRENIGFMHLLCILVQLQTRVSCINHGALAMNILFALP
jgi:hypothetical protein